MASNLVPGTQKSGTLDPAGNITISTGQTLKPGYVGSVTQNPPFNVEAGRTQAKSAYTTADNNGDPLSGGPVQIGTVSITGDTTVDELVATTYTASFTGGVQDATYAWSSSDSSATFSAQTSASTNVTFSTDGSFTLTCTVSSATAGDSPASAERTITVSNVAQPLTIALTSTDFTNGQAMPTNVGTQAASPGDATNPALAWSASGDNTSSIATYVLSCVDTSASNFVHWNVTAIANSTTSIAATSDPAVNNWTGTPTIGVTGSGAGAAMANGWELANPPSGETHNYSFTIQALDSGGSVLATSNALVGTYTTP